MSYSTSTLNLIGQRVAGSFGVWHYTNTDAHTDVDAADYFSDGDARGMKVYDIVYVIDTDTATLTVHYVTAVTAGGAASVNTATLS